MNASLAKISLPGPRLSQATNQTSAVTARLRQSGSRDCADVKESCCSMAERVETTRIGWEFATRTSRSTTCLCLCVILCFLTLGYTAIYLWFAGKMKELDQSWAVIWSQVNKQKRCRFRAHVWGLRMLYLMYEAKCWMWSRNALIYVLFYFGLSAACYREWCLLVLTVCSEVFAATWTELWGQSGLWLATDISQCTSHSCSVAWCNMINVDRLG